MSKVRCLHAPTVGVLFTVGLIAACGGDDTELAPIGTPPVASAPVAGSAAPQASPPTAAGGPTSNPALGTRTAPGSMAAAAGAAAPVAEVPASTGTPTTAAPAGDGATWCGVKRTLDSRCTACHNEQKTAGAPMSLKTYADLMAPAVSDASKKVFQVVGVRVHDKQRPMPPQEKLTVEQLSGIDGWVAAGAPAGEDPTCAAEGATEAPATTQSTWPDNCDDTYTILSSDMGGPNAIGAGQETHPQFSVPAPWGNEEVQAIAWRAVTDNAKVLHHWILYGPSSEFLFGWAPGKDTNEPMPPDVGVYLPAGSMRLDVHYNNTQGTATEMDSSGVEICVLRKPNFRPKTATITMALSSFLINIPPRAVDAEMTGECAHSGPPVRLLSVSPHAHRTAHHMKFTVEKASGETIVMHDESFNFEEQFTKALTPPIEIVEGDRIITTCTYTNDTDQTITFGENTGNEMCFNFAMYEPMGGLNCGVAGPAFPQF